MKCIFLNLEFWSFCAILFLSFAKTVAVVWTFGLKMNSFVLGNAFIMAIVFGFTLTIRAKLPLAGLLILMVLVLSSTSIHFILDASQPLAPVSFNT